VEHGVSGLLFDNGNEGELARHLEAVASARAFPTHAIPDAAVQRMTRSHDPDLHTERLRGILMTLAKTSVIIRPSTPTALPV
jgi:hypothetical protein